MPKALLTISPCNAPDGCGPNPLGSQRVTEGSRSTEPLPKELGFETLKYNAVAAQMSRGKSEKILAFAMSSVAATLAKFSMDVCLYMSQILISSLYQRI
jgi:argininosuccinate lyase